MKSGEVRTPKPGRRLLLLALMDVAVAAALAVLVFKTFGSVSGVDTNPPECYNSWGGVVSCSLTPPVVMLPTACVVLLALAGWQAFRWRKGRVKPSNSAHLAPEEHAR